MAAIQLYMIWVFTRFNLVHSAVVGVEAVVSCLVFKSFFFPLPIMFADLSSHMIRYQVN